MATVHENIPAQPTTKNAAVALLTHASVKLSGETISSDGLVRTAEYTYESGDAADQTTVRVTRASDLKNDMLRCSVRLTTIVETTVGDVVDRRPGEAVIAWNIPGQVMPDTAEVLTQIEAAFGLLCGSFDGTTGVPGVAIINAINFGRVINLW